MKESGEEEYVDFSVIREEFSTYKLQNDITFRLKIPLVAVIETNDGGVITGKAKTGILSYPEIPVNFNMSEFQTLDSDREPKQTKEMRIIQRKEIVNVYETKSHLLVIGVHIDKIFITDKKDIEGNPILSFSHELATTIVGKPVYSKE